MSAPTTWTAFGPDLPAAALPPAFQACLPPAQPSAECDGAVGSAAAGYGFCSDPTYRRMTYCACVNNSVGCPEYAMASCANAAYSYKPAAWYAPKADGLSQDAVCAKAPVCVNLVVGNTSGHVTQQCGTIRNITAVVRASPLLAVVVFILVLALVVVMSQRSTDDGDGDGGGPGPNRPEPAGP